MKELLIKNGRVIDPLNDVDDKRDLLVRDGKIVEISRNINAGPLCEVIDASGKIVMPGLVDMHVHLRDPGREDEETIATGTRAAAAGGFTSIACMANTDPVADNSSVIEYIVSQAKKEGIVNVFPIGAVTVGLKGEVLAEIGRMREKGAVAFSDDGRCIMNSRIMRNALEYAKQFNTVIISHCEDHNLSSGGHMNESYLSTILGIQGIPVSAEEAMVDRDISLAEEYNAQVHIAHVSTAGSVERIKRAKEKGIKITCETAPHYFALTEAAVEGYNTYAKVNPPLRSEKDVAAIINGLKDGVIDAIASDHAPHSIEEKNVEFTLAANGMCGLETTFGLVISELVETKILALSQAVRKLTINPATILGINKGDLSVGSDADIVIADITKEFIVDRNKFESLSKNSPFNGWKLKGKILYTIAAGEIVYKF